MAIEIGSISTGTLNPRDLIPTFLMALEGSEIAEGIEAAARIRSRYPELDADDLDEDWCSSEDGLECLGELMDALDDIAPEGCTFGSHVGDAADYGFWPVGVW